MHQSRSYWSSENMQILMGIGSSTFRIETFAIKKIDERRNHVAWAIEMAPW